MQTINNILNNYKELQIVKAVKFEISRSLPALILLLLSIIWGSSFILIKKALKVFPPEQVGSIRIAFAFIVMIPIALKHLRTVYKGNWKMIFLLGLVANLLPALLFSIAQTGISSSLSGILNSLTPLFTLIIGLIVFKTEIRRGQVSGIFISLAGSISLSFIGSQGSLGSFNFFALFVVAATLCYGIGFNMIKSYFQKVNSVVLTSLAMFSVGPFALIFLTTTDFTYRLINIDGSLLALFYLFILGAVGTALALVLFNKLIQITSPVFASTVTYLIPIVAVMWGIFDGEAFFLFHFIGMALIISGVYIVNRNN